MGKGIGHSILEIIHLVHGENINLLLFFFLVLMLNLVFPDKKACHSHKPDHSQDLKIEKNPGKDKGDNKGNKSSHEPASDHR